LNTRHLCNTRESLLLSHTFTQLWEGMLLCVRRVFQVFFVITSCARNWCSCFTVLCTCLFFLFFKNLWVHLGYPRSPTPSDPTCIWTLIYLFADFSTPRVAAPTPSTCVWVRRRRPRPRLRVQMCADARRGVCKACLWDQAAAFRVRLACGTPSRGSLCSAGWSHKANRSLHRTSFLLHPRRSSSPYSHSQCMMERWIERERESGRESPMRGEHQRVFCPHNPEIKTRLTRTVCSQKWEKTLFFISCRRRTLW